MSLLPFIGFGQEKEYFIENLSLLLASGMNIIPALDAIGGEIHSARLKGVITQVRQQVEDGSPIWRALQGRNLLPDHIIALIRVGEQAGKLTENLKVITVQQQKDRDFRSKLRSALMYPTLVMVLAVVVGLGISWYILPRLATVFSQLKIDLPLITKGLIAVGLFMGKYGAIVIPTSLLGLAVLFYLLFGYPKTKFIGQSILINLPIIRRLIQEVELSRFGFVLGTLLDAGLPVTESLDSLSRSTTVRPYQRLYALFKTTVEEGNSFQKSFERVGNISRLIPRPIQQLIVAGEQSGRLPEVLFGIAQAFDAKTETTTKNLTVILEPILLIIVWLGVVAVALAVILPIYGLLGGLNP